MKKEFTLENMTDKLDKKVSSLLDKFSDDEILFLFKAVDVSEIFLDAFNDRFEKAVERKLLGS